MRRLSLVFRALVIAWVVLVTLMTYAALRARGRGRGAQARDRLRGELMATSMERSAPPSSRWGRSSRPAPTSSPKGWRARSRASRTPSLPRRSPTSKRRSTPRSPCPSRPFRLDRPHAGRCRLGGAGAPRRPRRRNGRRHQSSAQRRRRADRARSRAAHGGCSHRRRAPEHALRLARRGRAPLRRRAPRPARLPHRGVQQPPPCEKLRERRAHPRPRLVDDLCTRRVLTMQFVDGVRPTDVESDRGELAIAGFRCIAQMVFLDGFVHADMHPGNILFARTGKSSSSISASSPRSPTTSGGFHRHVRRDRGGRRQTRGRAFLHARPGRPRDRLRGVRSRGRRSSRTDARPPTE